MTYVLFSFNRDQGGNLNDDEWCYLLSYVNEATYLSDHLCTVQVFGLIT